LHNIEIRKISLFAVVWPFFLKTAVLGFLKNLLF